MSEMVERVARALYVATPFKETEGGYDEQSVAYKRMCRLLARAAFEAMREPMEAMLTAGSMRTGEAYAAMIEAALKEKQDG